MKLRTFSPWIIAAVCCLVLGFAAFHVTSSVTIEAPEAEAVRTGEKATARSVGSTPGLADRLLNALPLSPPEKAPAVLVAAMIENHEDARPYQKGLHEADVVFELFVEGDISRFIAFYNAHTLPAVIEPIRSLRPHFVSIARGYLPLLLHAGGSQLAYDALAKHTVLQNHDGLQNDGITYERDPATYAPHNLMIREDAIRSVLAKTKLPEVELPLFGKRGRLSGGIERAREIHMDYNSEIHNVSFVYDGWKKTYRRSIYNADDQARPANIVILKTYVEGLNERTIIPWTQTFGRGELLLFSQGKMWEGMWEREKGKHFTLFDTDGNPLQLGPGQVWVAMVDNFERISWEK